jgi:hypothetical protein
MLRWDKYTWTIPGPTENQQEYYTITPSSFRICCDYKQQELFYDKRKRYYHTKCCICLVFVIGLCYWVVLLVCVIGLYYWFVLLVSVIGLCYWFLLLVSVIGSRCGLELLVSVIGLGYGSLLLVCVIGLCYWFVLLVCVMV